MDLQKDNPDRATLIELVNTGRLESPYNQSLNLDTYSEVLGMVDNVKVSDLDKTGTACLLCRRRRSPLLPYAGSGIHL